MNQPAGVGGGPFDVSLAYLRARKLDKTMGKPHGAIDLVEQTRGGGGLNIIFAVGRELRPWQHEPGVQDVYDRMLALMAA